MPEEWFSGSVAQTVGRRRGLSAAAVHEYKSQLRERWEEILGSATGGCLGSKPDRKIPVLELDGTREENLRRMATTRSMRITASSWRTEVPPEQSGRRGPAVGLSGAPSGNGRWRSSFGGISETQSADNSGGPNLPDLTVETLVGTALMFAFMAASRLLPMEELGRRQRATALYFGDEAGTFLDMEGKFAAMMDEGTLMDNSAWFKKVRDASDQVA